MSNCQGSLLGERRRRAELVGSWKGKESLESGRGDVDCINIAWKEAFQRTFSLSVDHSRCAELTQYDFEKNKPMQTESNNPQRTLLLLLSTRP